MVEPGHLGAAPQVVALLQPLRVLGAVEEVDEEAERVLDPDDLAEAAHRPGGQPLGPAAERRVVRLRPRQVRGGPHPVAERARPRPPGRT